MLHLFFGKQVFCILSSFYLLFLRYVNNFCNSRLSKIFYVVFLFMLHMNFKKSFRYYFCIFTIIPSKFVIELWVANEAPYYLFVQLWFDLLFFFHLFLDLTAFVFVANIAYILYIYLIAFGYLTIFFGALLYSSLWFFVLYGCVTFFCFATFFAFFFLVSLGLYLIDVIFKTPVAGLVLLSRDFMSIEDEDLWVSSNVFHMDMRIKEAEEFVVPLKSKEIEVFTTLIKLFFDMPFRDLQYGLFSGELVEFRSLQRAKFLEKKRLRALSKGFVPKRKFRRFKKYKKKGPASVLLKSRQDQFLLKASFHSSHQRVEKLFYKFLFRNLKFYIKKPTKKKRKKRLLLLKHRFEQQQFLSLRFKDRASFSRNLNPVSGINFSTRKLILPINDSVTQLQPKIIRNDLVKPYLIPRVNLKDFIFGSEHTELAYQQTPKIPRFRRFLWFSMPFYLSEISYRFSFVFNLVDLRRFVRVISDWLKSKFFNVLFAIFEDSWALGPFRTRYYSPRQLSLTQFLKLNNLSFVPMVDNPEDMDDSPVLQQVEVPRDQPMKFEKFGTRKQKKKKTEDSKEKSKTSGSKESEKIKRKKKLKKKAYRNRLRRKWGTARKTFLVSRNRYNFPNISNVSGIQYPELQLLHLYKLLEYFYFVFTNDLDFYETVTFSAKVALLRDKYGQAIVTDLLEKKDHKQASKVSVVMHVTDRPEIDDITTTVMNVKRQDEWLSAVKATESADDVSDTESVEAVFRRQSFRASSIKVSSNVSNFARNLLLSYRYRFRF